MIRGTNNLVNETSLEKILVAGIYFTFIINFMVLKALDDAKFCKDSRHTKKKFLAPHFTKKRGLLISKIPDLRIYTY